MAVLDQRPHETEEQGEQQGRDVLAVDVGVGHQHDLVIAQLADVELVVDARAEGGDDRLDLGVLENTVDACLLDVDDLAAQRKDRLVHRVAPRLGAAACGVALHDVDLALARVVAAAVGELAGETTDVGGGLATHQITGVARGHPSPLGFDDLLDDGLGLGRIGLQPVTEVLAADALDEALDLGVAEFGLGLSSNCGSLTFTEITAARPSRMSSPERRSSFFSLMSFLSTAYLFTVSVSAARKPSSWVPPSCVLIVLAKV